jgi:fibronectin type 3 domain-containing protein
MVVLSSFTLGLMLAQVIVSGKAKISGQTALSSGHYVALQWTASTSTDVVGYNVYRGPSNGPYVKITNSPTPGTTYTDFGVQATKTYCYVTTAVDKNNNESGYSNQSCGTVP